MKKEAMGFWKLALKTIESAKILLPTDANSSISCSFYAAFYAVSALFAKQNKSFSKHSAIESAVHRDLVKTANWRKELGADYSNLLGIRSLADYSALEEVTKNQAEEAIKASQRIIDAVHNENPDFFTLDQIER